MSESPDRDRASENAPERGDFPDGFVRNAASKRAGAGYSLAHAFACAGAGIAFAFRTQRNMKIHALIAAIAVALGFAFSIDAASWLAIIVCIALVIALECVNTAIESVVDLVSPDYHDLAKHAKDCAAGAVYIAAIAAVAVEAVVIVPRVVALVSG